MGEVKKGSVVAKELGIALAQVYNYIRKGAVVNRMAGGWPVGKGVEVDVDEVRAAMEAARSKRGNRAPRRTKADKEAAHQLHDELDREEAAKRRARGETYTARKYRYQRGEMFICPVDPDHGPLYKVEHPKQGKEFHCNHVGHDGRAKHQAGGFAPQTQSYFTREEVENGNMQRGRLGQIMLEWIYEGRADLAEDLERWMQDHGLEVWIPER